jgi:hypothetical protein
MSSMKCHSEGKVSRNSTFWFGLDKTLPPNPNVYALSTNYSLTLTLTYTLTARTHELG